MTTAADLCSYVEPKTWSEISAELHSSLTCSFQYLLRMLHPHTTFVLLLFYSVNCLFDSMNGSLSYINWCGHYFSERVKHSERKLLNFIFFFLGTKQILNAVRAKKLITKIHYLEHVMSRWVGVLPYLHILTCLQLCVLWNFIWKIQILSILIFFFTGFKLQSPVFPTQECFLI